MRRRKRDIPQPTSIRLPPDLRRQLERRAVAQGSFLSVYIVWLLRQAMDRLDRGKQSRSQIPTIETHSGE